MLLDLIIEKTPALRAAGVQGVELDGLKFAIAPDDPGWTSEQKAEPPEDLPPLDDPETYGIRSRGAPSARRTRSES